MLPSGASPIATPMEVEPATTIQSPPTAAAATAVEFASSTQLLADVASLAAGDDTEDDDVAARAPSGRHVKRKLTRAPTTPRTPDQRRAHREAEKLARAALANAPDEPDSEDQSFSEFASPVRPAAAGRSRVVPGSATSRLTHSTDGTERSHTGLRHFGMKVCECVQAQQRTTYAQVADALIETMAGLDDAFGMMDTPDGGFKSRKRKEPSGDTPRTDAQEREEVKKNEKNVRRRVYDALNVMESAGVITKHGKQVEWVGLPVQLEAQLIAGKAECSAIRSRIELKRQQLSDLLVQQVCLKTLIDRNQKAAKAAQLRDLTAAGAAAGPTIGASSFALPLPSVALPPPPPLPAPAPASPMPPAVDQRSSTSSAKLPFAFASPPSSTVRSSSTVGSGVTVYEPRSRVPPNIPKSRSGHSRYARFLSGPVRSRESSPLIVRSHPGIESARVPIPMEREAQAAPHAASMIRAAVPASVAASMAHSTVTRSAIDVGSSSPRLSIPFVLLHTASSNVVHVQMTDDQREVIIGVSGPLTVAEHWGLLKMMGFDRVASYDLPRLTNSSGDMCDFYPPMSLTDYKQPTHHQHQQATTATALRSLAASAVGMSVPPPAHEDMGVVNLHPSTGSPLKEHSPSLDTTVKVEPLAGPLVDSTAPAAAVPMSD